MASPVPLQYKQIGDRLGTTIPSSVWKQIVDDTNDGEDTIGRCSQMVQHVSVSEDRVPVTVVTSYALHEKYVKQLFPLEKAKQMSAAAYTGVCLELATLPPFPAYQLDVRGTWKRAELPRYNNYLLDEVENEKSVFNTVFYGNVVRKYDVELKNLVACAAHFEVSTLSRATLFPLLLSSRHPNPTVLQCIRKEKVFFETFKKRVQKHRKKKPGWKSGLCNVTGVIDVAHFTHFKSATASWVEIWINEKNTKRIDADCVLAVGETPFARATFEDWKTHGVEVTYVETKQEKKVDEVEKVKRQANNLLRRMDVFLSNIRKTLKEM